LGFGSGLYAKEVDYLVNNEWAVSCDDILWRRSKLGLQRVDIDALTAYLENK
jgi:glycerol-3-phosphate dehydrogenase